jgi:hypothetical protein
MGIRLGYATSRFAGRGVAVATLSVVLLASISFAAPVGHRGVVAYIEQTYPDGKAPSEIAFIKRSGVAITSWKNPFDLLYEDQIFLKSDSAILAVRVLATNKVVIVRKASKDPKLPDLTIRSPLPGLMGEALTWYETIVGVDQSDDGLTLAGGRGVENPEPCFNKTGMTNVPTQFQIPIFSGDREKLGAGKRSIFVSWKGGVPPFSVSLTDAKTNQVIAAKNSDLCTAHLPSADLMPQKKYNLIVTDAKGVSEEEDEILVVEAAPSMPAELLKAGLSEDTRRIYFATWLTTLGDGEWTFEAQQQVAAIDCRWAPVADWLQQWGGGTSCD